MKSTLNQWQFPSGKPFAAPNLFPTNRRLWRVAGVLAGLCFSLSCVLGQEYRVLHHFAGSPSDGATPMGALVLSGSTLYGVTCDGGASNLGTIFKINTDTNGFELLYSFNSESNGVHPRGSLLLSGSTLYGLATSAGSSYGGSIFKIGTDGSNFTVLRKFSGMDGKWPYDTLTLSGTNLYGVNTWGPGSGWTGYGTVFRIDTNGSTFKVLHTFAGGVNDGRWSYSQVIPSGTNLYGTTLYGGSNDYGVIFKAETDRTNYTLLHTFRGGSQDGAYMDGSLVLGGSTLYGMTYAGGSNDCGTIFKINTDGTNFTLLRAFRGGSNDGQNPGGSLILSGPTLYGMTGSGGTSNLGTIFKINTTNGNDFSLLHSFKGAEGASPGDTLLQSGSTLFGMTPTGGSYGKGVIFALDLAPKLAISLDATNVNLSWSTNYPGFALESVAQLGATWTTAANSSGSRNESGRLSCSR
jgi:uncharacterized repeat protein (TIGR03803 family)